MASIVVTWWIAAYLCSVISVKLLPAACTTRPRVAVFLFERFPFGALADSASRRKQSNANMLLTLKVLVATIDAQWEGMGM